MFSTRTRLLDQQILGIVIVFILSNLSVVAQQQYEVNSGWKCYPVSKLSSLSGVAISKTSYPLTGWMPAVVPGTVLTSQLHNKLIPDPFYGMNNKKIPDIYDVGREYYTYWFAKDFDEPFPAKSEKIWLEFRGINYSADIFINGTKVNDNPDKGMYLRQSYDITSFLSKDGHNRLAVVVYPPDPVGNPNGGQGGDGTIAHSITNQYTAGWDWIQPIHDRNTGIWDKVFIKKTKQVHVEHTHVVTLVSGKRFPDGAQKPATVKVTTEVENPDGTDSVSGTVLFELEGKVTSVKLKIAPQRMELVEFPSVSLEDPKLWWPNGYGSQNLYKLKVKFLINGRQVSDEEEVTFGVRELKTVWNTHTNSREIRVNGQKIFIKGGNWITSDAMLRFSKERYDAEVRYHRDMNLNLIRVWGGGLTERPEFYDACDKYGLLVFQDFWITADCNGRWHDPYKKDDTLERRKYPDDHQLFLEAAEDQIRMLRNHPSLAIWCGGNEIRPPADILTVLRDSLLPSLDGTRYFFEYSNHDSMSLHAHDGPYTIQHDKYFWEHRSFAFNSEIGSVGIGDYESLERFIPKTNMVVPKYDLASRKWKIDSVWQYHKYSSYDSSIEAYGHPTDVKDFVRKAQVVNYNQYRALIEGASAHMWDWYTGIIIWKTQNPWTAMVGQMYDVYLDPNAALFGLQEGSKPLHVMYNPVAKSVMVVNNGFKATGKLRVLAAFNDVSGNSVPITALNVNVAVSKVSSYHNFGNTLDSLSKASGGFLSLYLYDSLSNKVLDENIYWLPDVKGSYSGLAKMKDADVAATAKYINKGKAEITISNPKNGPVAFFMRVSLIDTNTYDRILPVFCDNNYITLLPGQRKTVHIDYDAKKEQEPMVTIEGWNVEEQFIEIKQ
ncbi:MAG: glycosyl hydrolase [Flavipsychrobacter sp.]|nr:glycosyl hydrolase [Flavipsychrobacter sp.]